MSLSRETAEFVAHVVDARARGQQILITRGTCRRSEAYEGSPEG